MKNKLLLVSPDSEDDSQVIEKLEAILSISFEVKKCNVASFRVDYSVFFYVLAGDMSGLTRDVMRDLREMVINRNATLVLYYSAFSYLMDIDFYSFTGVRMVDKTMCVQHKLRVFPHYLSRGLKEVEELTCNRLLYETYKELGNNDNIFILTLDNIPLAYEKVYGKKGRVIGILFGQDRGVMSGVEERIFANLALLLSTAEDIDHRFGSEFLSQYPLDKGELSEKHEEVNQWNTLVTADKKNVVYTHSSIFLPLSPGYYFKKMTIWTDCSQSRITKENLYRSLMSVEIRSEDRCNMDCYYCYNRRSLDIDYKRTNIPEDVHIRLEEDLIAMRSKTDAFSVRYTGAGEPLCHIRTIPSIMAFEKAGIPTCLITNGLEMTPEEAATLSSFSTFIRISMDAIENETYAKIRRCNSTALEKVIRNIEAMDKSRLLLGTTFLVCRENFRQIFRYCEAMKKLGVRIVWVRSIDDPDDFSEKEFKEITKQLEKIQELNDSGFIAISDQYSIYRKVSALHYRQNDDICWSSYSKAFIQPNGDVIICLSHEEFIIGNIKDDLFSEIWGGERHIQFIRENDFSKCSQCIESRYNHAIQFMISNHSENIVKVKRRINV